MKVRFYKSTAEAKWSWKTKFFRNAVTLCVCCFQWILVCVHLLTNKKRSHKYHMAICLIFKNEGRFLREWIEYHLLIGVDHFYLYNNFSDDNYLEVLEPYINDGCVTLVDWPYLHAQKGAYQDCYDRFASECHWLAYIDADEFINLQKHDNIRDMLHFYRHQPALQLQWRDFGTSGLIKSNGLVTEDFVAAWPWLCNVGKTIINTDYSFNRVGVHYSIASFKGIPLFPVNDLHLPAPLLTTFWKYGLGKTAYINHYFSKAYDWYIYKDQKRGDVLCAENEELKKRAGRFELHELNNFVHDYSIQRWLVLLKLRMRGEKL